MNDDNGDLNAHHAAECKRLREQIARLEAEWQKDRDAIAQLTKERDEHLKGLYAWSRAAYTARYTKEELETWAANVVNEQGYSFEEILESLGISEAR